MIVICFGDVYLMTAIYWCDYYPWMKMCCVLVDPTTTNSEFFRQVAMAGGGARLPDSFEAHIAQSHDRRGSLGADVLFCANRRHRCRTTSTRASVDSARRPLDPEFARRLGWAGCRATWSVRAPPGTRPCVASALQRRRRVGRTSRRDQHWTAAVVADLLWAQRDQAELRKTALESEAAATVWK